jgi:hypothetical protein
MRIHDDKTNDTIIEKNLQLLALKFNFIVCSIEEAKNINELQSYLLIHEQKLN